MNHSEFLMTFLCVSLYLFVIKRRQKTIGSRGFNDIFLIIVSSPYDKREQTY